MSDHGIENNAVEKVHISRYLYFLLLLLLNACDKPNQDYFPLDVGYWWEYSIELSMENETIQQKYIAANLARKNINGEIIYPRRRANGKLELYRKTEAGIERTTQDQTSAIWVLHNPLEQGTRWQAMSKTFFLSIPDPLSVSVNNVRQEMMMEYVIESINDTIKVPAGTFSNCMRIKSNGSANTDKILTELLGVSRVKIEHTDWYAPGVGLVKSIRHESTWPLEFNGIQVQVLNSYSRD